MQRFKTFSQLLNRQIKFVLAKKHKSKENQKFYVTDLTHSLLIFELILSIEISL